jgi:hypothetical protein
MDSSEWARGIVNGAYGSVVSNIAPVKEIDRCSDHRACWDKSIFANKENIHQNLICGIGMGVMETPVRTPCDHLFCSHCINQVYSCPLGMSEMK